ncbi:hypothetical protein ApAK_06225 [Thermoplasmatales archaeon AK]|nr:hypothetical protein [Thermoplasmatales archaeon AK]
MLDKEDKDRIVGVLSKYYNITDVTWDTQSVVVKVPDFSQADDLAFAKASLELEKLGFISFTNRGIEDEIIVTESRKANDNRLLKVILIFATLGAVSYFGYVYQSQYSGETSALYNIGASLVFYLIPISLILASREVGKYVALKKNGMNYYLPILVPNPLGIGTMGIINSPNHPFKTRKSMLEVGAYSILFGFTISLIFYLLGVAYTLSFPPHSPGVNSPIEKVGSPLLMSLIINRVMPSTGLLDTLAFAGWSGIVITAFNAFPLGFLDGGLISSALLGKNSVYLSYVSVIAIVALGILYPPWLILAVFALLVGMKGPQALDNITGVRVNGKAISAVVFILLVLGMAPVPFHNSLSQFQATPSENSFVLYGNNTSISLKLTVNDTGQSSIVPAFSVSPGVSLSVEGSSITIPPGRNYTYTVSFVPQKMGYGLSTFNLTVFSGSYYRVIPLQVLYINLTEAISFNGSSPYVTHVGSDGRAYLSLSSDVPDNITLVSVGNSNFYLMVINESISLHYTKEFSYILGGSNIGVQPGKPVSLDLYTASHINRWYIAAFDSNFTGTVAVIEPQ